MYDGGALLSVETFEQGVRVASGVSTAGAPGGVGRPRDQVVEESAHLLPSLGAESDSPSGRDQPAQRK